MAKCKLDGMDGGRCPIDNALCRKTHCKHYTGYTNADRIRAMSAEGLAEYGVHGCIPAGCTTPAWYGHFKGFASTKAEAIQREKDWLIQPAQEEV